MLDHFEQCSIDFFVQSKEKLIASLKEGLATGKSGDSDFTVLLSEMEGLKQEKDTLREQLQNAHIALDSVRREMAVRILYFLYAIHIITHYSIYTI